MKTTEGENKSEAHVEAGEHIKAGGTNRALRPKGAADLPREVIEDFKAGNHEAYKEIYIFYNKAVRRFLFSFRMSDDLLEDVAQEVFIKLWERRAMVDPAKGLLNYILYLSRNTAIDQLRRAHLENRYLNGVELDFAPEADADILHEQTEILVEIIISSMPEQRQRIFRMSRLEGLSPDDIAEKLGISKSNVYTQLHYALRDIKNTLPVMAAIFLGSHLN